MLRVLHWLLVAVYLALPVGAVALVVLARRGRQAQGGSVAAALASLMVSFIAGLAVAVTMCLLYGRATGGHVPLSQVLLATYFATSLLLLLRLFDNALLWGLQRTLRVHRPAPFSIGRAARISAALLTRALVLIVFGLPFVMAALMTYRPKVQPADDPQAQLGFAFERVEFAATDGVKLVGWWIPAAEPSPRQRAPDPRWGRRTVIVCHGLAASKSNQLILSRLLVPGGFNVLAFDFRAHGESGGQLTGYGALESRDVLGAVRWIRQRHSDRAEKIFGVGASMGAVALIGAAADRSPEGQAIDAVATYAAYDDLSALTRDVAALYFRESLGWLLENLALPVASVHAGADLARFRPAERVSGLWPRPILFIHGHHDEIIPFERGQALRDAASPPRYHLWFPQGSHNDIVTDEPAARVVLEFFRQAQPLPMI